MPTRRAISVNNVGVKCLEYELSTAFRNFMDALDHAPDFALAHKTSAWHTSGSAMSGKPSTTWTKLWQSTKTSTAHSPNRGLAQLELGDYQGAL